VAELVVKCWCGVEGPASEMFRVEDLDPECGGWGDRVCRCGGDSCVCHHHGSAKCDGCSECADEGVSIVAGG
jgi:hypothetical protein